MTKIRDNVSEPRFHLNALIPSDLMLRFKRKLLDQNPPIEIGHTIEALIESFVNDKGIEKIIDRSRKLTYPG